MSQSIYDTGWQLRAATAGAITATTSTTGIPVPARHLPVDEWVIDVTALGVVGTETYVFTLEVSNLIGGTYTAIATWAWPIANGIGEVHLPINGDLAHKRNTTAAFLRVTATLGGTTPTVTYGSFLTKQGRKMGTATMAGNVYAV